MTDRWPLWRVRIRYFGKILEWTRFAPNASEAVRMAQLAADREFVYHATVLDAQPEPREVTP